MFEGHFSLLGSTTWKQRSAIKVNVPHGLKNNCEWLQNMTFQLGVADITTKKRQSHEDAGVI